MVRRGRACRLLLERKEAGRVQGAIWCWWPWSIKCSGGREEEGGRPLGDELWKVMLAEAAGLAGGHV